MSSVLLKTLIHFRNILIPYWKVPLKKEYDELTRKIFIFYHIYCGPNNWKKIVIEQLSIMRVSELMTHVDKIYITVLGNDDDLDWIKENLHDVNYEIIYFSNDGSCFEFPCLAKMQHLARSFKFYALYIHTKGSSKNFNKNNSDHIQLKDNIESWRALLNYYNINKWKNAIYYLNKGYYTYGCLLMKKNNNFSSHYSGNFWWSTSENCLKSFIIENNDKTNKNRWIAEQWIVNNYNKAFCPFYSWVLLYDFNISNTTWLCRWYNINNIKYILNHWKNGRKHLLY